MKIIKQTQYTLNINKVEYEILSLALRHVIMFPPPTPYSDSTMNQLNHMLSELNEYE